MWYCAHAIFYFKLKYKEEQESYFIHENVYLVQANDADEAMEKSLEYAREEEDSTKNDSLVLNGKEPVCFIFAGIRKLITVDMSAGIRKLSDEDAALISDEDTPISGCELTYSELEVDTLEEVEKLANGEFVDVLYRM
ncbi:MAG: DUF4288 domain-containing protein [Thiotrichaceae bacterium]|nr:DUF4288 domain-containing protein [Thiotrichaceae bacterium]